MGQMEDSHELLLRKRGCTNSHDLSVENFETVRVPVFYLTIKVNVRDY